MRDERGWYLHEKAWIVAAKMLFVALESVYPLLRWARLQPSYEADSRLWTWLLSESSLYEDLRRHDLPENVRIGGVWR